MSVVLDVFFLLERLQGHDDKYNNCPGFFDGDNNWYHGPLVSESCNRAIFRCNKMLPQTHHQMKIICNIQINNYLPPVVFHIQFSLAKSGSVNRHK